MFRCCIIIVGFLLMIQVEALAYCPSVSPSPSPNPSSSPSFTNSFGCDAQVGGVITATEFNELLRSTPDRNRDGVIAICLSSGAVVETAGKTLTVSIDRNNLHIIGLAGITPKINGNLTVTGATGVRISGIDFATGTGAGYLTVRNGAVVAELSNVKARDLNVRDATLTCGRNLALEWKLSVAAAGLISEIDGVNFARYGQLQIDGNARKIGKVSGSDGSRWTIKGKVDQISNVASQGNVRIEILGGSVGRIFNLDLKAGTLYLKDAVVTSVSRLRGVVQSRYNGLRLEGQSQIGTLSNFSLVSPKRKPSTIIANDIRSVLAHPISLKGTAGISLIKDGVISSAPHDIYTIAWNGKRIFYGTFRTYILDVDGRSLDSPSQYRGGSISNVEFVPLP